MKTRSFLCGAGLVAIAVGCGPPTLNVRVVRADNGEPLTGVRVTHSRSLDLRTYSSAAAEARATDAGVTDSDGRITLGDVSNVKTDSFRFTRPDYDAADLRWFPQPHGKTDAVTIVSPALGARDDSHVHDSPADRLVIVRLFRSTEPVVAPPAAHP